MYRNQELPAALARGQLLHLDEYNARAHRQRQLPDAQRFRRSPASSRRSARRRNARVLHVQRALRPGEGGSRTRSRGSFRIAVEKALYAEGLLIGQWQTMPVPAQDLFQSKLGYGGTGFPWSINEAKGVRYNYDPRAVPRCAGALRHLHHRPWHSCAQRREPMDEMIAAFTRYLPIWTRRCPRRRPDLPRGGRRAVRRGLRSREGKAGDEKQRLFGKELSTIQEREREIGARPRTRSRDREGPRLRRLRDGLNFVRDWNGDHMALGHEIAARGRRGRHGTYRACGRETG